MQLVYGLSGGVSTDRAKPTKNYFHHGIVDRSSLVEEMPPAEPVAESAPMKSQSHEQTAAGKTNQRMFTLAAGVLLITSGALPRVLMNQNEQQEQL